MKEKILKIIKFLLIFGFFSLITWAINARQYTPGCWQYNDEHYVMNGMRYTKQFPVDCSKLKQTDRALEQSCFTQQTVKGVEVKTFVSCP